MLQILTTATRAKNKVSAIKEILCKFSDIKKLIGCWVSVDKILLSVVIKLLIKAKIRGADLTSIITIVLPSTSRFGVSATK